MFPSRKTQPSPSSGCPLKQLLSSRSQVWLILTPFPHEYGRGSTTHSQCEGVASGLLNDALVREKEMALRTALLKDPRVSVKVDSSLQIAQVCEGVGHIR